MNNNISIFDENTLEYDNWFEKHPNIYQSEILALKKAIPKTGKGIEIGVGTGRFAKPLNIKYGVEPSENMAKTAEQRGITIIRGIAEELSIEDGTYDFALMVTTVCFLSDIPKAFSEVHRILKVKGEFILAIIDKNSELGKKYQKEKKNNKFYKDAHFHSTEEITQLLAQVHFDNFSYWQTLKGNNQDIVEKPIKGFGKGSFVVIKIEKGYGNTTV